MKKLTSILSILIIFSCSKDDNNTSDSDENTELEINATESCVFTDFNI